MPSFINITGKRFGRLIVLERLDKPSYKGASWLCKCDCGNSIIASSQSIRIGHTKSCGCYNKEIRKQICIERNTTHNKSKTKVFHTWTNIRQRCNNPNISAYHKYGAKGIKVCERWNSFENFFADMGNPPTNKHTIERIDSRGHYEPSNCKWATMEEQQNNRTNNRLIEYNKQKMTLQKWSKLMGIDRKTISRRIDNGWPIEKALFIKPIIGRNQYSK